MGPCIVHRVGVDNKFVNWKMGAQTFCHWKMREIYRDIIDTENVVFEQGCRGVVPLRHLRHVPPPDGVATLVNSLQNRVKSITVCVTLNANNGKIVLVTLCIQIEWLFYNAFWCETNMKVTLTPSRARGHVPHFYK